MKNKQSEIIEFFEESSDLLELLFEKQFQLSDIGLADNIAFTWTKAGLYIEKKRTKGRRKYNAMEYVWLRMVTELREFGLPFKSIKKVKASLLNEIDFRAMLTEMLTAEEDSDEEIKAIQKEMKTAFASSKELNKLMDSTEGKLVNSVLTMLVYMTIIAKSDVHLLIKKDGTCITFEGNPMRDMFTADAMMNGPFISFPLRHIVSEFIEKEELYELDELNNVFDLTPEEKELLINLRKERITNLKVKTGNESLSFNVAEKPKELQKAKELLKELFEKNESYQITYNTQNSEKEVMMEY